MELQLADRVAIVTGGGMGIGRAVARELLLEGMSVAICSRTLRTLETTAGELMAEVSGRVEPIVVDTTDMSSVETMVSETIRLEFFCEQVGRKEGMELFTKVNTPSDLIELEPIYDASSE